MGLLVATAGRVLLPSSLERTALTVLEVELAAHDGRFHADRPVDDLDALARCVGVALTRDGDWLVVATDREDTPEWSAQSAAFLTGLGRFVTEGEVQVRSADGRQWAYRYSSDGLEVAGMPADPGAADPLAADPGAADPAAGTPQPPAAAAPSTPAPPPSEGSWDVPPTYGPPPVQHPGPGGAHPYLDPAAPAPRSPGRTLAMAVLFLGGLFLIVAVAVIASGMV